MGCPMFTLCPPVVFVSPAMGCCMFTCCPPVVCFSAAMGCCMFTSRVSVMCFSAAMSCPMFTFCPPACVCFCCHGTYDQQHPSHPLSCAISRWVILCVKPQRNATTAVQEATWICCLSLLYCILDAALFEVVICSTDAIRLMCMSACNSTSQLKLQGDRSKLVRR